MLLLRTGSATASQLAVARSALNSLKQIMLSVAFVYLTYADAFTVFKGVGVRLLWNGVWVGVFLYVQRVAYLDAQKFSLELVGAADAWAAGFGSSLKELVRFYTT